MAAPRLRYANDACRSVGSAVEPSIRVLPPQSPVKRSSGGGFARSLAGMQCR